MSNKKNIVFKSVEEYNKKFRHSRWKLLNYSKDQVEQFDKKYFDNKRDYLLEGRKWTLIGDRYYEIPKAPRLVWFRNLNSGVKIITSVLLTGGVASAVTIPTLMFTVWNKDNKEWYEDTNYINSLTENDVGTLKEVTVNGQVHKVRLIGIEHDDLATGNGKAHTTWEFANLISDDQGYSLAYQWNDALTTSNPNTNYPNSSIRKVLCGSGDFSTDVYCATKKSLDKDTWDSNYKYTSSNKKTILSMLPDKLQNVLKSINKNALVKTNNDWTMKEYKDKLFLLSCEEMGTQTGLGEINNVYKYYNGADKSKRIKQQVKGDEGAISWQNTISGETTACKEPVKCSAGYFAGGGIYWLCSPSTNSLNDSYICDCTGSIYISSQQYSLVNKNANALAPAFCI